jgi:hypothetical protein
MVGQFTLLYYICSISGLLMVSGGIWLIAKQKIYVDPVKHEVLAVELPIFGKLKTNVPALALFIIGFIPLIYPIAKSRTDFIVVHQESVSSNHHPVAVYAVVHAKILQADGELNVSIPVLNTDDYNPELIYVVGSTTVQEELRLDKAQHGYIELKGKIIEDKMNAPELSPKKPDRPAEF